MAGDLTCDYQPSRVNPCGKCAGCMEARAIAAEADLATLRALLLRARPAVAALAVTLGSNEYPEGKALLADIDAATSGNGGSDGR